MEPATVAAIIKAAFEAYQAYDKNQKEKAKMKELLDAINNIAAKTKHVLQELQEESIRGELEAAETSFSRRFMINPDTTDPIEKRNREDLRHDTRISANRAAGAIGVILDKYEIDFQRAFRMVPSYIEAKILYYTALNEGDLNQGNQLGLQEFPPLLSKDRDRLDNIGRILLRTTEARFSNCRDCTNNSAGEPTEICYTIDGNFVLPGASSQSQCNEMRKKDINKLYLESGGNFIEIGKEKVDEISFQVALKLRGSG